MTKTELLELIRNGENSGVEFKRGTMPELIEDGERFIVRLLRYGTK